MISYQLYNAANHRCNDDIFFVESINKPLMFKGVTLHSRTDCLNFSSLTIL